jgi:hypothetical protein
VGLLQGFVQTLQVGQGKNLNAFVEQLAHLLRVRLAPDGTGLRLAMVHAPNFLWETLTHIFRALNDLAQSTQYRPLQL